MPQIKNKNYRQFLDDGVISTLGEEEIKRALLNVKGKHIKEGRALIIMLYYTGARPNEVLQLQAKSISREKSYVLIQIPGSKGGLARPIYLPYRKDLVKEMYKYAIAIFPDQLLFYHYRNNYTRVRKLKSGQIKEYTEITSKLYYFIKKWFDGVIDGSISTYFLRHNRFSKLSIAGANDTELRQLKGSKTVESIRPYQHLSKDSAMKIAKKID